MTKQALGETQKAVFRSDSRRGLGTAPLGSSEEGPLWWGPQDHAVAVETVLAAIDAGAAFIDTAPFYGWGRAEQIVAEALARTSHRPPVYTKCGTIRRGDSWLDDAGPRAIRSDVLASLDRLGLDQLDVVQVHDPDPNTPIEETWEALMTLADEGLIGGAGLSNSLFSTAPPRAMARSPGAATAPCPSLRGRHLRVASSPPASTSTSYIQRTCVASFPGHRPEQASRDK